MFVSFQQISPVAKVRDISLNATQVTDIAPSPSGGTYVNVVGHEYVIEVREPFEVVMVALNEALRQRG